MKKILLTLLSGLFLLCCEHDPEPLAERSADTRLILRWVPAYAGETRQQVETGLRWSFSFLGASLPPGALDRALRYSDEYTFELRTEELGFTPEALQALRIIVDRLKNSGEYQARGSIDLGRFLLLTLHSSWHYYQITGAAPTLAAFRQRYPIPDPYLFATAQSTVGKKTRIIRFQLPASIQNLRFLAEETEDVFPNPVSPIQSYEVLNLMPNGQLRFAIYDNFGNLAPAAPIHSTRAGKPGKCLWCHETKVQRLFAPSTDIPGFMPAARFVQLVDSTNQKLADYRAALNSELNFAKQSEHTLSELLYISFMEPSLQRLAREWQMSEAETRRRVQNLSTHVHDEFPFLGELYQRSEVDPLGPYPVLAVPKSVREENAGEPNFFR